MLSSSGRIDRTEPIATVAASGTGYPNAPDGDRREGDCGATESSSDPERVAMAIGEQSGLAVLAAAPHRADRMDDVARRSLPPDVAFASTVLPAPSRRHSSRIAEPPAR